MGQVPMVSRRYILHQRQAPGAMGLYVDQTVLPAAIDAAATAEAWLEETASTIRRRPRAAVAVAALAGLLLAALLPRRVAR